MAATFGKPDFFEIGSITEDLSLFVKFCSLLFRGFLALIVALILSCTRVWGRPVALHVLQQIADFL